MYDNFKAITREAVILKDKQLNPYVTHHPSLWKDIREHSWIYLLMLPGIIYFFVFCYIPMLGIVIAFQDFNPLKGFMSEFVGFQNFSFFFTSLDWVRVTVNTIYLNILFIISGTVFPIAIAIMICELNHRYYSKTMQSLIILPHFVSWAVVSMFMITVFTYDGGIINKLLMIMGMERVDFYGTAKIWPPILVLMKMWKEGGFSSIVYIATITGIDQQLYETAKIDGASRWQSIFYITLPQLKGIVMILTLLSVGKIFYGDFGMIYAIIGDNALLYETTDVIDTFVFRALRLNNSFGMSAAVGLYQSIVGFILVLLSNKLAKKVDPDSGIF